MSNKGQLAPVQRLKNTLSVDSVQEQFQNALAENAPLFVASLIDIYSSDTKLQECEPGAVISEALKAATLKLPINKNLGFAYIVPYKSKGKSEPQMQIGYKGYIQLAMRTGEYRYLNADKVYDGELKSFNKLTGHIDLSGPQTGDTVIGYFAYLELLNGFSKGVYWTKEEIERHGKKYSPSYSSKFSAWQTDFDSMALKTVLRNLISKWGIMSVEMIGAFDSDMAADSRGYDEIDKANTEELDVIDVEFVETPAEPEIPEPDF